MKITKMFKTRKEIGRKCLTCNNRSKYSEIRTRTALQKRTEYNKKKNEKQNATGYGNKIQVSRKKGRNVSSTRDKKKQHTYVEL